LPPIILENKTAQNVTGHSQLLANPGMCPKIPISLLTIVTICLLYPSNYLYQKEVVMPESHFLNTFLLSLLFLAGVSLTGYAQDESLNNDSTFTQCSPVIFFHRKDISQSICLNHYSPQGDSCAEIQLVFKNFGIKFNFSCDKNHLWNYSGNSYSSDQNQITPVNISLTTDDAEKLSRAVIILGQNSDTSILYMAPFRNGDIPVIPDRTKPLDYDLNILKFICIEKPKPMVITDREFTIPADIRHKEPVLNYPELSAFHYGGSVRMPSDGSIQIQAYINNYWHFQKPRLTLECDDPELIRKREIYKAKWAKRHPPKKKRAKSDKPPLLRFKPL
jgi:hypothetical protein